MSSRFSQVAVPVNQVDNVNVTAGTKRPRSNTSGSTISNRRTKSRASTPTTRCASTQPIYEYQQPADLSYAARLQHAQEPPQYSAEEMITRSEQQLTNPNQAYIIDPSLRRQMEPTSNLAHIHDRALSLDHNINMKSVLAAPALNRYHSFDGKENFGFEPNNDEQAIDDNGIGDGRKKKGSASSIANDIELRRLFSENMGRSLKDVASQVLAHERGPRSEKTKQIFAMLWLNSVCQRGNSSVPRNRVFSHYATRCGTERVPPLNPASFGKLVRIIFPGIQTRRLGMRGESKYHYVDLSLVDDQHEVGEVEDNHNVRDGNRAAGQATRYKPHLQTDTAVFPSPDLPGQSTFGSTRSYQKNSEYLYLQITPNKMQQEESRPNMVGRELKFSTRESLSYQDDEAISLPSIHSYVPVGTDPDAADALAALYRSHCISVIDAFRFCKEKMLWHHFTSFHGTLTVPVQKLFAHPSMAAWIKECDWFMYQKMVQFVSPLALQVVPIRVIDTFRAIATKLAKHVIVTFQSHPEHVRDAKLGPATIFAGLLDRLLRVNETAHAAANMLTNDANRDQMWHDWVLCVKPMKVVESSLPGRGYLRTLRILATEIRHLLAPLSNATWVGMDPIFAETINDPYPGHSGHGHPFMGDSSTEGVLDRWTNFLQTLPSLFPRVDARTLLHSAGSVGNAALRDITMAQALSFGSWWVTKTWVDEMLLWMAEKGGFMEHTPNSMIMRGRTDQGPETEFPVDDGSDMFGGSRPRTAMSESADEPNSLGNVGCADSIQVGPASAAYLNGQPKGEHHLANVHAGGQVQAYREKEQVPALSQNPDDSGIGLDIDQDELRSHDYSGFVSNTNVASDPADVVVC